MLGSRPSDPTPNKSLGNPVKLQRVSVTHLFSLVFRHADERIFDKRPRLRIGRCDMRIIGFPHDIVDADQLAQLDARLFVPEVDVDLPTEDFAWSGLDPFLPQLALFPLVIGSLQNIADPAESGFGACPFEPWISVENAGEDEIGNQLRRRRAQPRGRNRMKFFAAESIPFWQR